jgi:hypothetical protein
MEGEEGLAARERKERKEESTQVVVHVAFAIEKCRSFSRGLCHPDGIRRFHGQNRRKKPRQERPPCSTRHPKKNFVVHGAGGLGE